MALRFCSDLWIPPCPNCHTLPTIQKETSQNSSHSIFSVLRCGCYPISDPTLVTIRARSNEIATENLSISPASSIKQQEVLKEYSDNPPASDSIESDTEILNFDPVLLILDKAEKFINSKENLTDTEVFDEYFPLLM